jgi:hypothetical protein
VISIVSKVTSGEEIEENPVITGMKMGSASKESMGATSNSAKRDALM